MILIRIILFCLLALFFYGVIRVIRDKTGEGQLEHHDGGEMVPCAYCALHVPRDKAIASGAQWYCCDEHKNAADAE